MAWEGVRLFVGGDAQNVQGRRFNQTGDRCFSAAYGPGSRFTPLEAEQVCGLLDSGAFSDPPGRRLDPEGALARQLAWEQRAARFWGRDWQAWGLVSYDLLIDEKWTGLQRRKQRWSVPEADHAVRVTVEAARFLAGQRPALSPRRLVLAVQGVDAAQYLECCQGVLDHAAPGDCVGLGGWCILGQHRSWIPTFWTAMRKVLPEIARKGISHVHIFGVLYEPCLAGLLWLCDQHGLRLSTDSSGPVLNVVWKDQRRAGAVCDTWEANVAWWLDRCRNLRGSPHYREPPNCDVRRQATLF